MKILRWEAAVVLAAASNMVWPQQPPAPQSSPPGIEIKAEARPSTATVGDPIRIEFAVSLPRGSQARLPELKTQVGDFSVLESQAGTRTTARPPGRSASGKVESGTSGADIQHTSIVVALFRTGSFEFPSLPITIRDISGKEYPAASPPVKIEIRSVLTGKEESLKDLKKQAEIEDPAKWLYRLGLVLLLLTLAVVGWLLWRKQRKPAQRSAEIPGLDPFTLAEADLRDLVSRGLLERGFVKQFYVALSEIVRRVIEGGYRISTSEKTTSEIMEALSQISPAAPSGAESTRIQAFLTGCDLVKFARHLPSKAENDASIQAAQTILETCRRRSAALAAQAAPAPVEVR